MRFAVAEPNGVRFGVGAMISPRQVDSAYSALAHKLGSALQRSVGLFYARSYRQLNDLLRTGKIDIAFIDTGAYLELRDQVPTLPIVAVPQVSGQLRSELLVVVHAGQRASTFAELAGTRFIFGDPLSLAGRAFPLALLRRLGKTPQTFFAASTQVGAHDRALAAVEAGVQGATSVSGLAFAHYRRRHPRSTGLRVLQRFGAIGNPPIVARPQVSAEQLARWRAAFAALHTRPAAMQALSRLGIERFVAAPRGLYTEATALWRRGR